MSRVLAPIVFGLSTFLAHGAWAGTGDPLDPSLTPPPQITTPEPTPQAPEAQPQVTEPVVVPTTPAFTPQELPPSTVKATTIVVNKPKPKPHYRPAVIDLNCGVPSGCVGELGVRPLYWLKLEAGAGYNGLAPGVIGSVVIDPIPWGLGLSLSMDAGHYWSGSVPYVSNSPSIEYSFLSPMAGIELGNYRAWRFYLRGGLSYLDMTGSNFQGVISTSNSNGVSIGNPHVDAWVGPAFKLGLSFYF